MRYFTGLAVAMTVLVGMVSPAQAYVFGFSDFVGNVELILDGGSNRPIDGGWYRMDGLHQTTNPNYIVNVPGTGAGTCTLGCNNFFAFDISDFEGSVTSASLRLNSFDVNTNETYTLFDYTGSITSLLAGTAGAAAWSDLRSGISFGSRAYLSTEDNTFHTIALNSSFLTAFNTAIEDGERQFAFGGTVDARIPEPATMALTGLGLLGLYAFGRRRRTDA